MEPRPLSRVPGAYYVGYFPGVAMDGEGFALFLPLAGPFDSSQLAFRWFDSPAGRRADQEVWHQLVTTEWDGLEEFLWPD